MSGKNGYAKRMTVATAANKRIEVGAFYWTVLAPEIVNSGREKQVQVSV